MVEGEGQIRLKVGCYFELHALLSSCLKSTTQIAAQIANSHPNYERNLKETAAIAAAFGLCR